MSSGKLICFTDSRGKSLFSLPDSSFLCLEYEVQKYPPVCKADGEEWNPVSAYE